MTLLKRWRPIALGVGFALLAWVGFEIGRAGNDVPRPGPQGPSELTHGSLHGKRIDQRGVSLDFEHLTVSADGTSLTLDHIRDGRFKRPGKSDVRMSAERAIVNRITNDVDATGPVTVREDAGGRTRTFSTIGARYIGATRTLILDKPATITDGKSTVTVSSATINFRTGASTLGRIEAVGAGSGP